MVWSVCVSAGACCCLCCRRKVPVWEQAYLRDVGFIGFRRFCDISVAYPVLKLARCRMTLLLEGI